MKLIPLHDHILIERIKDKMKGTIIIPETAKEKYLQGKIIKIGDGRIDENGTIIPLGIKVGDIVFFHRFAGNEIDIDGKEYLIVREDDILAIKEK